MADKTIAQGTCEKCGKKEAVLQIGVRQGQKREFNVALPDKQYAHDALNLCETCASEKLQDFCSDVGLEGMALVVEPDKELSEEDKETLKNIGLKVVE